MILGKRLSRIGEGRYACKKTRGRLGQMLHTMSCRSSSFTQQDFHPQITQQQWMVPLLRRNMMSDGLTLHLFPHEQNCIPHALKGSACNPTCQHSGGWLAGSPCSLKIMMIGNDSASFYCACECSPYARWRRFLGLCDIVNPNSPHHV